MDKSKQKKIQCDKNKVQNSKNKNWQAKPNRSKGISFSESNKLLYDIENSKITYEEALERIRIFPVILIKLLVCNSNQINVVNTLFMVNEIFNGEIGSVEVNEEGNFEVFKEKSDKKTRI